MQGAAAAPSKGALALSQPSEPAHETSASAGDDKTGGPPLYSWAGSWGRYIRGNVVSKHSARIITNFLTATLARTAEADDSTDEEAEGPGEDEFETLPVSQEDLQQILGMQIESEEQNGVPKTLQQHVRAVHRGQCMWGTPSSKGADSLV